MENERIIIIIKYSEWEVVNTLEYGECDNHDHKYSEYVIANWND